VILVAIGLAIIAAISDIRTGKVSNSLTIPAMVFGVALGGVLALPCLLTCGALAIAVQRGGRVLGAGDLKLLAAMGALLGPAGVLATLLVVVGVVIDRAPAIRRPLAPDVLGAVLVVSLLYM
jgi:prepilin peptidase CpaA